MRKIQILLLLFLFTHSAFSQNGNENFFSFLTEDNKVMTLYLDTIQNEVIYLYGYTENPEVEVRDDLDDSLVIFSYSYYLRGGGIENSGLDLNYVTFKSGDNEYTIYSEYSAEENSTSVGIRVVNLISDEEYEIAGLTATLSGSLISFRDIIPNRDDQ